MKKPEKESRELIGLKTRRHYLTKLAMACGSLTLPKVGASQQKNSEPLDFGFLRSPPGTLYSLGRHRLHAQCLGEGDVTVLFEPGLGGSALEWIPIAETLKNHTNVKACLYDRAGYAWSDPGSNPRHVVRLAGEAKQLLGKLNIERNIILVGHSFGGLIVRQLASIMPSGSVIAMLLVDASHEEQFTRLAGESDVAMLPSSRNFVVSAPSLPEGLRDDIKRKILALSRMRKTYTVLHAEIDSFLDSCNYIKKNRATFDFPVRVLSRGLDPYVDDKLAGNKDKIWHELQAEFLDLSKDTEQIIAQNSGHHVHVDRPEVVIDAIKGLISKRGGEK